MSEPDNKPGLVRRWAILAFPPFAVFATVVGIWYAISEFGLSEGQSFLLPPPHEVIQSGFFDSKHLSELMEGLRSTVVVILVGLSISIVLGMTAAILMNRFRWFESTFFPYAIVIQATPIIAIVPLIGVWMGFSFNARVLVVVIISIFPIITNTLFGLKSVDRNQLALFELHGAGGITQLRKLLLPAASPAIFTGFRISAGLGVVGAIVGEFFFKGGTQKGLGRLISRYQAELQTKRLLAAIMIATLLGVVLFIGVGLLSDRVTRAWHETRRDARS